eukprot:gnl/Dysnectes_brevis/455_a507_8547.p2 GENE.gnl/Dysnectes_brevis/455_a507_8547~~gnl/Dysnectes_brevis/455_a507_8547.p2  ORF type:complete len:230 (-),score=75.94 gnl/Dysnectes_brevis/455_a507_8547:83-772(-)
MSFTDLQTVQELTKLNSILASRSYVNGFEPTKDDSALFDLITKVDFPHVIRWVEHMRSFSDEDRKAWNGDLTMIEMPKAVEKKVEKAEESESDDLDLGDDLFGSDSDDGDLEAELKAQQEKIAEAKAEKERKAKKAEKLQKSMLILHVSPYDDEAPMDEILKQIPEKVTMDGLTWGQGELTDGPYGIKIAVVAAVIEDDNCSADDLCEAIVEAFEDTIQGAQIMAFNKL